MPQSSGYKLSILNEHCELTDYWSLWLRQVKPPCLDTDNNDMSLTAPQLKVLLTVFDRLIDRDRGTYLISGNLVLSKTVFGVTAFNLISGDTYCFSRLFVTSLRDWIEPLLLQEPTFKAEYESQFEGLLPHKVRWF